MKIGGGAEDVVQLACAGGTKILCLPQVEPMADATAVIYRQHNIAFIRQVLVECVHETVGTHRVESWQHLPVWPAMEEQQRRAARRCGMWRQEEFAMDGQPVRCRKNDCLWFDEMGRGEIRRDGLWGDVAHTESGVYLNRTHRGARRCAERRRYRRW